MMNDLQEFAAQIKKWGQQLGFQQIGITDIDLTAYEEKYQSWLQKSFHGKMGYMSKHGALRWQPQKMVPNTIRVISARIDYLPTDTNSISILNNPRKAYISRYALGSDYHKLVRKRLAQLAKRINACLTQETYRVFCDSAPVLEKPLAEKAGLGWIGKHTNLINKKAGSWFFLGEIFTNLPLPIDESVDKSHCGSCHACIDICPTKAIVAPYQLDARKCISYLTIELRESIPIELRPLLGNRIYGCDDCQLICPWNKFAKFSQEDSFSPRHHLDTADLLTLFAWDKEEFLFKMSGSAIKRIGHELWLRNIAIALGNAPFNIEIISALHNKSGCVSDLVQEHIHWAIGQQKARA